MLLLSMFLSILAQADEPKLALPPETIIHFGNKADLKANAAFGNVPSEAWDRFIMGKGTRYGLVPWRRGLYGGTDFDHLEKYGDMYFGQGKVPWIMEIKLKPECRTPESVAGLDGDPRFGAWVIAHINDLIENSLECLQPEMADYGFGCDALFSGNAIASGTEESRCDRVLQNYLEERKARVVTDGAEFDAWYIRDRTCIESIHADANTIVRAQLLGKWDWESRKTDWSGMPGVYGGVIFSTLLGAFAEDPNLPAPLLTQLREKALASDIVPTFLPESPEAKNFWIRREIPRLLDAYERCQQKGQWEKFRQVASDFEAAAQKKEAEKTEHLLHLVSNANEGLSKACR